MQNPNHKKKKIVLATTPQYFVETWYSAPLGLAYIASALELEGYEVKIIDAHLYRYNTDKTVKAILDQYPDAVGITAHTDNRFNAIAIINGVKAVRRDVFVFAGGPHFSITAEDALLNIPALDVVVIGEGEVTTPELLNCYFSRGSLAEVKGICFRDDENLKRVVKTIKRPIVDDLDSLPTPAYHLLELDKYSHLPSYIRGLTREEKKLPAVGVISSRGCPNSCIFCANNSENMKTPFRTRHAEKFVDEIQYLNEHRGFRIFNFWDDTFTLSKKYVVDVCREIVRRRLKIKWYARGRVNTVDKEMLRLMKDAGCIAILYGAESGSDRILKIIKKNITIEQIKSVVRDSADAGMFVLVAFMISFPGEDDDDVERTLNLIKELRSYGDNVFETDLSPTTIYPGTYIEQIALNEGNIFPSNFSWNRQYECPKNKQLLLNPYLPVYTQQFTVEEIMAYRLRNKFQQQIKQSRARLIYKGFRFILGIRSINDVKTLILILKTLIERWTFWVRKTGK